MLGDPEQFKNALLNLALNGRDAMPGGGEIELLTALIDLDEDYCRAKGDAVKPGRYVRVSVSDTGVGMEPDVLDRMFEPFFTTKGPGEGTGMGLAAVYGTVEQHGGVIEVESSVGRGTKVSILLPHAPPDSEPIPDTP